MKKSNSTFNFILYVLVVLHVSINSIWSQNPIIGYTYVGTYNGHVYYLSDCTSDWYNANTAATEMGGYLVSISSLDENNFVKSILSSNTYAWIGANFLDYTYPYIWASGE